MKSKLNFPPQRRKKEEEAQNPIRVGERSEGRGKAMS
jgi:hypothetical protein